MEGVFLRRLGGAELKAFRVANSRSGAKYVPKLGHVSRRRAAKVETFAGEFVNGVASVDPARKVLANTATSSRFAGSGNVPGRMTMAAKTERAELVDAKQREEALTLGGPSLLKRPRDRERPSCSFSAI